MVFVVADIEAGIDRVVDLLALDDILQDMHGHVAHLEGPLTDIAVRQALGQLLHLHRQRVGDDDGERTVG